CRVTQVRPGDRHRGAARVLGEDGLGVGDRDGFEVHVGHAGPGGGLVGELVDVAHRRPPGAQVEELVDARREAPPHHPAQVGAVGAGDRGDVGVADGELLGDVAADGEVVAAAGGGGVNGGGG